MHGNRWPFDLPGVVYNFGRCLYVCLSVCQTITVERLDVGSSYLHIRCISKDYTSYLYMKVIGSRSRSQEQKSRQCIFPQRKNACQDNFASPQIKNSIANNSVSITHTAMKYVCSIIYSLFGYGGWNGVPASSLRDRE